MEKLKKWGYSLLSFVPIGLLDDYLDKYDLYFL